MTLVINGEARQDLAVETLAALVERLGLSNERLAIELDGEIVPRSAWPATGLRDRARIEIVRAIGGG